MNDQSSRETVLNRTLHVLVQRIGLTPEDVASLRLSNLHLAGKNPNLSFVPIGSKASKTIDLDLETHRALVGWLVSRPDSVSDTLILGNDTKPLDPLEIERAVEAYEQVDLDLKSKPVLQDKAEWGEGSESYAADKEPFGPDSSGDTAEAGASESDPGVVGSEASVPPRSTPEMGAPPPGYDASRPVSVFPHPPTTSPETGGPVVSAPTPVPPVIPRVPTSQPEEDEATADAPTVADPMSVIPGPRPGQSKKPRVPPKPVRKKGSDEDPVIRQRNELGQVGTEDAVPADQPSSPDKPEPESQRPQLGTPVPPKRVRPYRPPPPRPKRGGRFSFLPIVLVGATVMFLVCLLCVGGTGSFIWQSEVGNQLLVTLGLAEAEVEIAQATEEPFEDVNQGAVATRAATPEGPVFVSPISPLNSPLGTPTLPPTSTPTPLPPTDTPVPTETATPVPDVVEVVPTDTPVPVPTDTPLPVDTPTPEPPPASPTPSETETPTGTSEPALKYQAPALQIPEQGFEYIGGNTIVLRWQPVGVLAPDEQYAVRMVYPFNGQISYQGGQTKEPEWVVPLSLYGQIDPPDRRYEWFVVVERLNNDGSGTAISPESERRMFYWK